MGLNLHRQIGTFRQLEILLAVDDRGSITAAAAALALSQPTVSMQLKKLADTIGLPLYSHVGRRLQFTDAGHAVIATAREILLCLESLETTLSDLKGLKTGYLRLGVVTTSKYFIPHLLGDFCRLYPGIEIELNVANRQQIVKRMSDGKDDFYVFSNPPLDNGVELYKFLPNPLIAIAPQDHPLTKRKRISLAEFAKWPFLVREKGSGTRHSIEEHFREQGVVLNIKMTIDSNEAIKQAVMSGLGVSIVSSHTLAFGGRHGLKELRVTRLPIVPHWHLARLKATRMSAIAGTFLEYVETHGRRKLLADLRQDNPEIAEYRDL